MLHLQIKESQSERPPLQALSCLADPDHEHKLTVYITSVMKQDRFAIVSATTPNNSVRPEKTDQAFLRQDAEKASAIVCIRQNRHDLASLHRK
jgi:hypothetical protein